MPPSVIEATNPATGELINSFKSMSGKEITACIEKANEAFHYWETNHYGYRGRIMLRLAEHLRNNEDKLARLITDEMGKTLKESKAEVEKCALVCEYYAENTIQFLEDENINTDASKSYVHFQPLGVVLGIMPWNFPFWQVFRFAVPAMMAGNAVLLKHASNVPGCAEAIEEAFNESGVPKGLFANLPISSSKVEKVIRHPLVKAVALTGSEAAGRSVAKIAGECLKKTVLELGGSDAYVVLEDADLEHAADICTASRLLNCGQSCISAKRIIVVAEVYDKFLKLFKKKMGAVKYGDPTKEKTDIGPMARHDLRNALHAQVEKSIKKGADCVLGGEVPNGAGAFYPPTILINVKPGMPAYDEELFGPVAAVIRAKDEKDAVRIANDTGFGLGAAVFTQDLNRGERMAAEDLHAGSCFVNGMVKSDPRLPFGGIKESGYGRELSHYGIKEFVNIKTVWIK